MNRGFLDCPSDVGLDGTSSTGDASISHFLQHDYLIKSGEGIWRESNDAMGDFPEYDIGPLDLNVNESFDPLSFEHLSDKTPPQFNRIKKGTGPESKCGSPDKYDRYPFDTCSIAYGRLRLLGFLEISIRDLILVGNIIENYLEDQGVRLSRRNRAAHRRKPNAFHWIDENWTRIPAGLYDNALFTVLSGGNPNQKQGRKTQSK
jgi:hypothetical protein